MNAPALQKTRPTSDTRPTNRTKLWAWLLDPVPRRFLLPATGLWILALDWLLFSQDTLTLGLSTPLTAFVGFLAGSAGTYLFQHRSARDDRPTSALKALLAGLVVGVPFPLAGTVVGAWILARPGLTDLKKRLRPRRD